MVGWCFYFAVPVGAPPAAASPAAYVADGARRRAHNAADRDRRLMVGRVAAMNWFGVRVSGRVQLVIAGVLGELLLVAIVIALPTPTSAT